MTVAIQVPVWNSPADATVGLAALLDNGGGVDNVLVRLDTTNLVHRDSDPAYRLARYAAGPSGPVWYDARTGLCLYNVTGWQMAQ